MAISTNEAWSIATRVAFVADIVHVHHNLVNRSLEVIPSVVLVPIVIVLFDHAIVEA
jgi:hypothetical protein